MNRTTSRVTYKDILTNGKADTQRKHILKLLATGESLSRREIASVVMMETSSVSGRINELIKQLYAKSAKPNHITIINIIIIIIIIQIYIINEYR